MFGIACVILLTVAGAIGSLWVTGPTGPPNLALRGGGQVRHQDGEWYVRVTVENQGETTAEAVQILAELTIGGTLVEDGEQQIDFLASGARQAVGFVLDHNPANGDLDVSVASYKIPG
ncbi:TIGR02588 family protein [soil metagenome]